MAQNAPVITIDGPSGVGKGVLSQSIAKYLKWHLLDSGAIYRVLALSAYHQQVNLDDEQILANLAIHLAVKFEVRDTSSGNVSRIILEGQDVTQHIRQEDVGNTASKIAALPKVREALLARQHAFRQWPGLVADGRDMGTVVFPDAIAKIFLHASADERARRRTRQLQENGFSVNFDQLLTEIKARDERDQQRSVSPLVPADDALIIDSTHMTINDVLNKSMVYIDQMLKR